MDQSQFDSVGTLIDQPTKLCEGLAKTAEALGRRGSGPGVTESHDGLSAHIVNTDPGGNSRPANRPKKNNPNRSIPYEGCSELRSQLVNSR